MIDDASIGIWTCFSDKNVQKLLSCAEKLEKKLDESGEKLSGKEWRNLPFWKQFVDYVVPGTN